MFAARAPSTILRARPAAELLLRSRPSARLFHQTPKLRAMPKDPHAGSPSPPCPPPHQPTSLTNLAAHTVSQRVRQAVKGIPVEIYPLGKRAHHTSSAVASLPRSISREQEIAEYVECGTVAVIACGLTFGIYSFVRPAREDPTLRLHRSRHSDH